MFCPTHESNPVPRSSSHSLVTLLSELLRLLFTATMKFKLRNSEFTYRIRTEIFVHLFSGQEMYCVCHNAEIDVISITDDM